MKKLFTVVLSLLLALSLCAVAVAEPITIGIVQMADNSAFADMREGFIARIRELGYTEDQVVFDYRNAQGQADVLGTICDAMIENDVDLVVTIATPPTQAMVNKESGIPVFFISVSNPVGAGVISDMSTPDRNATGTSNAIPISANFDLCDQLTPGCETFGVIYCTSEVNSVTTATQAKEYLASVGRTCIERTVTSSSEVQQAAEYLIEAGVDAIFVPNDSVVQTAMATLAELTRNAGIPVYGSSAVMPRDGAFATISIQDTDIGAITADMVDRYLKGEAIENIPSVVVDQFTTYINTTTAEMIGVELSDEVLATAVLYQ